MIRQLNVPQLSSAKPRTGLQSIGELIPRLIRQYEIQAEIMRQASQRNEAITTPVVEIETATDSSCKAQATFGWD